MIRQCRNQGLRRRFARGFMLRYDACLGLATLDLPNTGHDKQCREQHRPGNAPPRGRKPVSTYPHMIKILIIIFLIAIIISLGSGLLFLVKDSSDDDRTVRALTWRIALSVAMIAFLVVAYFAGWVHPHGISP